MAENVAALIVMLASLAAVDILAPDLPDVVAIAIASILAVGAFLLGKRLLATRAKA